MRKELSGGDKLDGVFWDGCCLTRGFLGRTEMISESHSMNSTHSSPHKQHESFSLHACALWLTHTHTHCTYASDTHAQNEDHRRSITPSKTLNSDQYGIYCLLIINTKEFIFTQGQNRLYLKILLISRIPFHSQWSF